MFNTTNLERRFWVLTQLVFSVAMIIVTKRILGVGAEPLVMTWEMLAIAGLILFLMLVRRGEKLKKDEVKELIIPGIVGGGLAYWLGFLGLQQTQAANYAFLTKSTVVFTCILAFLLLKEKWTVNKTWAILLIILGSFLLSTKGKLGASNGGELLVLASSFCYAISYVFAAKSMKKVSALTMATYRTLIGALVLFSICLIRGNQLWWVDGQIVLGGLIVAISVLSAHKIMRISDASYMVLMSSAIPIATAILMIIFFGEKMETIQILGAGTIMLGTWFTEISPTKT
ncbi:MAG: DMT family transporter [Candidatus Shapirobacteria bacterium]|jgi:drug/metabolite transporter (DMT)-like permease